jgi:hypothetical protein
MPTFTGSLRLATDPESRVRADIVVEQERLVVRANGGELGNWALSEVAFNPAPGGFRVSADGEELILTTGDNASFAEIVGVEPPPVIEPATSAAAPGTVSARLDRLRDRSPGRWVSADTLRTSLVYVVMGSALVLVLASALTWGDVRLVGGSGAIPWGRVFTSAAALAAAIGAYMAWRQERRMAGSALAAGAGLLALLVMYAYARRAGLGVGFLLGYMATLPLIAAAVLGLTDRGVADRNDRQAPRFSFHWSRRA